MDGLLGIQLSRNDWSTPSMPMLHEQIRKIPDSLHYETQNSLSELETFEAQMEQYEDEFAAQLEDLGKHYVIPMDGSVKHFLNRHRALPQILVAALRHIRKYFPASILVLRASSDEFGWQNLYVDVLWPGEALDAFRLLGQFVNDWWIENSGPARDTLTFTYRLV